MSHPPPPPPPTATISFASLPDLACSNVGGSVLSCTDDFFAPASNLILPSTPVFIVGKFTENGKWMDGWESRRKRVSGYDWCILRLGMPGIIKGVNIDTAFFVGNFPESASIDAAELKEGEDIRDAKWVSLLDKSILKGGSHNYFPVFTDQRYTHLRLNIFPDGGVARLRVHGQPLPNWEELARANNGFIDLVSVLNGGEIVTCNDAFFGHHTNLILPGRAETMGDGWETRRKRVLPGFDWIVVKLGHRGHISKIEVDTNHFKGNFPDSCLIEGADLSDAPQAPFFHLPNNNIHWLPILSQVKLQAHKQHYYELNNGDLPEYKSQNITHVRMKIFPDGGISRLRMWGNIAK